MPREYTEHPATILPDLRVNHELGSEGLSAIFTEGSAWFYGARYENMETRVRVVGAPEQSRTLRDHKLAEYRTVSHYGHPRRVLVTKAPGTWFIPCEVIDSPFYERGHKLGVPPCAMIPQAAVVYERKVLGFKKGVAPEILPSYPEALFTRAIADALRDHSNASLYGSTPQTALAPALSQESDGHSFDLSDEGRADAEEIHRLRSLNGDLERKLSHARTQLGIARARATTAQNKLETVKKALRS